MTRSSEFVDSRGRSGARLLGLLAFAQPWTLLAQAPDQPRVKFATIKEADMREFLGVPRLRRASRAGRSTPRAMASRVPTWPITSEVIGASSPWGITAPTSKVVKNRGYRVTRNSSVTVEVNGQSRTFKHGDHVTFPVNAGGKQTLTYSGVEFVGYGIVALPSAANNNISYSDFAGRDVKGKAVIWMAGTPAVLTQGAAGGRGGRGGVGGNRANYAVQTMGAGAVFGYAPAPPAPTPAELALTQAQDALDAGAAGGGSGSSPGFGAARAEVAAEPRRQGGADRPRRPRTSRPFRGSTAWCRRPSRETTNSMSSSLVPLP